MNISNVKLKTTKLTFDIGGETANVYVMPETYTPEFEDKRSSLLSLEDGFNSSEFFFFIISTQVATWDFSVTEFDEKGEPVRDKKGEIVTRLLSPRVKEDVALIPMSIIKEITKGVRDLNSPGEVKEKSSESSFS